MDKVCQKNALNNLRKRETFRCCAKLLYTFINSNITYGFENMLIFFLDHFQMLLTLIERALGFIRNLPY